MRLPIQYALTYPERLNNSFTSTKLTEIENLTFHKPDYEKFECLKLAFDVINSGGTAPTILNAANEIAVDRFLKSEIAFTEIPEIIKTALNKFEIISSPDLETIIECDGLTRKFLKV
jgi:1-deoxy-D-xylulose-5-phosphate reductoisomerase